MYAKVLSRHWPIARAQKKRNRTDNSRSFRIDGWSLWDEISDPDAESLDRLSIPLIDMRIVSHVSLLNRRDPKSEPIALLLDDVIDIVAAMLGVLKSGQVLCRCSILRFRRNKIGQILHHSEAGVIVTNHSTLGLARQFQNEQTSIVNIDEMAGNLGDDNLGSKKRPDEFVSILYTSGSTGEPKGVVDNHLVNMHLALLDDTNPEDRSSLVHSVAFGSGRGDIFYSLLNGAAVCQFDLKAEGMDRFAAWLKEQEITICHLPPVAFRSLAPIFENTARPRL